MIIRRAKGPRIRHGERFVLDDKAADVWQEVTALERASLFATPRRCAEIERRQPEALEWGRSLIHWPDTSPRRKAKTRPIEEEEPEIVPEWRKTFSFEGQEELLADEELGEVAEETEFVAVGR